MIELKRNCFYKLVINSEKIRFLDRFSLTQFNNFLGNAPWGMKASIGHTIVIDLTQDEETIMQDCKSNTRNEIRRAERENFFFERVPSIDDFVVFYNAFAKEKGIETITKEHLSQYGDNIALYMSGKNGVIMTMHATALDNDSKIAILLYSASVRLSDNIDRKDIGFSNRFLHFKEFIEFKNMGLDIYDFNGISIDPNDTERYSISQFKAGFGGTQKDVLWLMSFPLVLVMKIRNTINRRLK